MKTRVFLFTLLGILMSPLLLRAQAAPLPASVRVAGAVKTALTLRATDLEKLEKTTVSAPDRNNKLHTYSGVLLAVLLQKAGATLGEELKGQNLLKYLVVEANDGYQVLFSLAEADPTFANKKIILANQVDGAFLSPEQGPFQIIVEGEKRKTRFIRQVKAITVKLAE